MRRAAGGPYAIGAGHLYDKQGHSFDALMRYIRESLCYRESLGCLRPSLPGLATAHGQRAARRRTRSGPVRAGVGEDPQPRTSWRPGRIGSGPVRAVPGVSCADEEVIYVLS